MTDLQTGQTWAYNGDTELSFMSSAKFPWVTFATAAQGVAANADDAVAIFSESDNAAAARAIERAGGIDALASWYAELGMDHTCTEDWYGGLFASTACQHVLGVYFNYSTANDMNRFLTALWEGTVPGLTAEERAAVLSWATLSVDAWAPDGDGTITGYLPPSLWPAAMHKISWYWGDGYLDASDVGIIPLPDGRVYAISVAAHGGRSSASQADYVSTASCLAYRAFSGDVRWNCATRSYDPPQGTAAAYVERDGKEASGTISVTAATYLMGAVSNLSTSPQTARLTVSGVACADGVQVREETVAPGDSVWIGCPISAAFDVEAGAQWTVELVSAVGARVAVDQASATLVPAFRLSPASGSPATFAPVTPQRLADTRLGAARLSPGSVLSVVVPASLAPGHTIVAAALNLTAVSPAADGYLTAWSGTEARPYASNVNYVAGAYATAASAIVPVSASGSVAVFSIAATDVVVDVTGVFTSGAEGTVLHAVANPTRLLDTRASGSLQAGRPVAVGVAAAGVPSGAAAVAVSLTALGGTGAGWLATYPGRGRAHGDEHPQLRRAGRVRHDGDRAPRRPRSAGAGGIESRRRHCRRAGLVRPRRRRAPL